MQDRPNKHIISADRVQRVTQPVVLNCSTPTPGRTDGPITVIPLVDGADVAGLEIRCSCGANVVIECVYEDE